MKVTLSAIREHYKSIQENRETIFPFGSTRRKRILLAVVMARNEAKDAERAEAEYREGLYDLAQREGSPEDDYEGELPY